VILTNVSERIQKEVILVEYTILSWKVHGNFDENNESCVKIISILAVSNRAPPEALNVGIIRSASPLYFMKRQKKAVNFQTPSRTSGFAHIKSFSMPVHPKNMSNFLRVRMDSILINYGLFRRVSFLDKAKDFYHHQYHSVQNGSQANIAFVLLTDAKKHSEFEAGRSDL
jgi:hypothetical protein